MIFSKGKFRVGDLIWMHDKQGYWLCTNIITYECGTIKYCGYTSQLNNCNYVDQILGYDKPYIDGNTRWFKHGDITINADNPYDIMSYNIAEMNFSYIGRISLKERKMFKNIIRGLI